MLDESPVASGDMQMLAECLLRHSSSAIQNPRSLCPGFYWYEAG